MRIVIDTNVFISSFLSKGYPRKVIDQWKTGNANICLSNNIVDEYLKVLEKLSLKDEQEVDEIMGLFAKGYHLLFASKTPSLDIVKEDPGDNKFFECAVELNAEYIISGDKAVKAIKKYFKIIVVSPREFFELTSDETNL